MKVKISKRALIQRINRKLEEQGETLKTLRKDSPSAYEMGRYYIVDISSGGILYKDVDLETLARELGALHGHETLKD